MKCKNSICKGTIPAPSILTLSLEYLILVKTDKNKVFKTKKLLAIAKKNGSKLPNYQKPIDKKIIKVKTELSHKPKRIRGFRDNITIDMIESSAKFGLAYGGYSLLTGGGESSSSSTPSVESNLTSMAVIGTGVIAAGAIVGVALSQQDSENKNNNLSTDINNVDDINSKSCISKIYEGSSNKSFNIELGKVSARTILDYETEDIKDNIKIYYEDKLLTSTGCVATKGDSLIIDYSGNSSKLKIVVQSNCDKEQDITTGENSWSFSLSCP